MIPINRRPCPVNFSLIFVRALVCFTATVFATPAHAQGTVVDAGHAVYQQACASCHGEAANGYGPAAHVLKQRPTDLTRYSSRTRPFPTDVIRNTITGRIRLEPSHGSSDMPMWRTSLSDPSPEVPGVTRMDALLAYLEAMQLRPYGVYKGPSAAELAESGSGLYRLHCAPCHGQDGRGAMPGSYVVGPVTPDLTTLASRLRGFDLRIVKERMARGSGGHGVMPDVDGMLLREGWHPTIVSWQIDRIARYVQSIQRR